MQELVCICQFPLFAGLWLGFSGEIDKKYFENLPLKDKRFIYRPRSHHGISVQETTKINSTMPLFRISPDTQTYISRGKSHGGLLDLPPYSAMETCCLSSCVMVFGERICCNSQLLHTNRKTCTPFMFYSGDRGHITRSHVLVSNHRPWPRISRKFIAVRATLMQQEEKTDVESDLTGQETGLLEYWAIKFEHQFNILLTEAVIKILGILYSERDYARFYVLETIARVPYFAFVSVLHMYESFGWWRRADYLKVHFAESWNELHHLLIMEALGGNEKWFDRFLAQHIAIFYYFMTVFIYIISPRMAYHFSECVEKHAFSTYDKFIELKGEQLKKLPAPDIAVKYYTQGDLYLFDEFQTHREPYSRRPQIENLLDVFINIRDDEAEHCKTMKACQTHGGLVSPHQERESLPSNESSELPPVDCVGFTDCFTKAVTTPLQRGEKSMNDS